MHLTTPAPDDLDLVRRIGDVFRGHGYTTAAVRERVGCFDLDSIRSEDLGLAHRQTADGSPLSTLVRLFFLNLPVGERDRERALAPVPLAQWLEAGFLTLVDGRAVAARIVRPSHHLLVVLDPPPTHRATMAPDMVMGIGTSSLLLASVTVRSRSRRTLDLGSGCGIQALLAAAHSDAVVAVDCNPRAVARTRLNAALNDLANVDCREGDAFAPLADERFDLVVTNPPFVVNPDTTFTYRDNPMTGDDFVKAVALGAVARLNQGGFCQMVCDWVHPPGDSSESRLASWFADSGCDVWVMCSANRSVSRYASSWIGQTASETGAERCRLYDRWLDYYQRQGIEEIGSGVVTIRKRAGGSNWFAVNDAPETVAGDGSSAVLAFFAARDWCEEHAGDDALLAATPTASPRIRMTQRAKPGDDGWDLVESSVELVDGLTHRSRVDPLVARLLVRCNGARTVAQLVAEMAAACGVGAEELHASALPVIRSMIISGYLTVDPEGRASER